MTNINLTPNPRILQMLGQISFDNWQCIAELIDNSIDAILKDTGRTDPGEIRVDIPTPAQMQLGAPITIWDNGPGMSVSQLENALKAGYSGNDPVSNLGLFGMGFNIATARLGEKTTVYTTQSGQESEIGIEIDFHEMVESRSFERPIIYRKKHTYAQHGTEIKISKLNDKRIGNLGTRRAPLIQKLSSIYSKLLSETNIVISINGDPLKPVKKCVWGENRHVIRNGEPIHAHIDINEDLGSKYYCYDCWAWLDVQIIDGETPRCKFCDSSASVRIRERKIKGWLGVQRYYDKDAYGIDIYRNGRLILANDKSLFYWKNPSDELELEYPIDAVFLGGRIVGEIEANFLKVNYTKDSFEKGDSRWEEFCNAIRGPGPLRPDIAERNNLGKNTSPLGILYSGYRKGNKPGFIDLLPGKFNESKNAWEANNTEPKLWAELFRKGNPEYQDDHKWWELVVRVEEDRRSSLPPSIVEGTDPMDPSDPTDPKAFGSNEKGPEDEYGLPTTVGLPLGEGHGHRVADELIRDNDLSGSYSLEELDEASISIEAFIKPTLPAGKPTEMKKLSHANFQYFYNPEACIFKSFGKTPKDMLLLELASDFVLRIRDPIEWPISRVYFSLVEKYAKENSLAVADVRERVNALFVKIRKTLAENNIELESEVRLDPTDLRTLNRAVLTKLGEGQSKANSLIRSTQFLLYMPNDFIGKFFKQYPEHFFDGRIWKKPYNEISDVDIRTEISDEFTSYITDALWILSINDEDIQYNPLRFLRNVQSLKALEWYLV